MTKWTQGFPWEPTEDGTSVWEQIDASVGFPNVFINGIDRCAVVQSARWTLGRDWWFARPEPGTCTITLTGAVDDIEVGQSLVIRADPSGVLWTGRVDSVLVSEESGANDPDEYGGSLATTTVTGADWMAMLARLDVQPGEAKLLPSQTLDNRVAALAQMVGAPAVTKILPAVTPVDTEGNPVLPTLKAHTATDADPAFKYLTGTLLSHLDAVEMSANAIAQVGRDGTWRILPRAAHPSSAEDPPEPPPAIPLVSEACPYRYERQDASVGRVINVWAIGKDAVPDDSRPNSKLAYGRRDFTLPVVYTTAAPPYSKEMKDALANPLPAARVWVRVKNRLHPLIGLDVFDFVSWRDEYWQVLGMEWVARAISGRVEWEVLLDIDRTQNVIAGAQPSVPPVVTPPTVKSYSGTLACTKDSGYVNTSSGGNGAGPNVLVGKLADGQITRGAFAFAAIPLKGTNRKVVSATITFTTDRGGCMQWGSSPKFYLRRITASWSEGSFATGCSWSSSNASKWPGPAATTTGQVSKTHSASDGISVAVDVKSIVQAWLDGSPQYGVLAISASETSSAYRTALKAAHSARLAVTYQYEE
jgi:hypothetical protein